MIISLSVDEKTKQEIPEYRCLRNPPLAIERLAILSQKERAIEV